MLSFNYIFNIIKKDNLGILKSYILNAADIIKISKNNDYILYIYSKLEFNYLLIIINIY